MVRITDEEVSTFVRKLILFEYFILFVDLYRLYKFPATSIKCVVDELLLVFSIYYLCKYKNEN